MVSFEPMSELHEVVGKLFWRYRLNSFLLLLVPLFVTLITIFTFLIVVAALVLIIVFFGEFGTCSNSG